MRIVFGKTPKTWSQTFHVIIVLSANFGSKLYVLGMLHAECITLKTELLRQPNQPANWRRKVEHVFLSPRRGRHNQIRLTSLDASGRECRLKCRMCDKKQPKNVKNVLDWEIQLHSAIQELTIDNAGITSMAAENTIFWTVNPLKKDNYSTIILVLCFYVVFSRCCVEN